MTPLDRHTRLRVLVLALIATMVLAASTVIVIKVTGEPMGRPCVDSYGCAEFLTGGECLEIGSESYCSRYCDADPDCPPGWSCGLATPTVLGVTVDALDGICVPDGARGGADG